MPAISADIYLANKDKGAVNPLSKAQLAGPPLHLFRDEFYTEGTGSVSGTTLTITAVAAGGFYADQTIYGSSGSSTTISSQTSGTPGGIGVYALAATITGPTFNSGAVVEERRRIAANGAGIYGPNQAFVLTARSNGVEDPGKRLWTLATGGSDAANAANSHARKVDFGGGKVVSVDDDTNLTAGAVGIPNNVNGRDGDRRADFGAGRIYGKAAGVWVDIGPLNNAAPVMTAAVASALLVLALATGQSAAVANTTAIQAAIDAGTQQVVIAAIGGGTVHHNAIQYTDGTTLVTMAGTQLRQADNTNNYMLTSKAQLATAPTVTVTWSAGAVANLAFSAAHGLVQNDALVLQGGLPAASWDDIYRVASVVDSLNVTVRLPFIPTASPTGTTTATRCHRNVKIDVALDYNLANNGAGTLFQRMGVICAFLADSSVKVRGANVNKYVTLGAGCDNVTFDISGDPNSNADTFKLYGPGNNNTIIGRGQAPEDCLSTQCLEPANFIGYMPCRGNIRGTVFEKPNGYLASGGSGAIVIYADDTYKQSGTVINGGDAHALGGTAPGINIRAGIGFTATQNNLGDITVRRTRISSAGGDGMSVSASGRRLLIDAAKFAQPGTDATRAFATNGTITWDEIIFDGIDFAAPNWPSTGGQNLIYLPNSLTAKVVKFRNDTFVGSASTLTRLLLASATIDTLILEDCTAAVSAQLLRLDTAAIKTIIIRGGSFACTNVMWIKAFSPTVSVTGGAVFTGVTGGIVQADQSTASPTVLIDDSVQLLSGSIPYTVSNSGTVKLKWRGTFAYAGTWSAAPALDFKNGNSHSFTATVAGTFAAPANVPPAGEAVTVIITQDATGGRAISWNAAYVFPTAFSNTGNAVGTVTQVVFRSDGAKLVAQNVNTWY